MGLRALNGDNPELNETRCMVRKRLMNAPTMEDLAHLLKVLKLEKFSGSITILMNSGGVRSASAEDRRTIEGLTLT